MSTGGSKPQPWQDHEGSHSHVVELGPVDHAAIARACDCYGERVEAPTEVESALKRALGAGRPAVLDVLVDPSAHSPLTILDGRTVEGGSLDT